ncbi:unnamed protein product [Vitrella brassicaformis CCMP3155]|uniref:Uncharacterized protein n=1 Tax=Vitrella brassicaformis (strain CCMP3155) TaxID=1169540 RepID=A0A0G4EUK9_VITBC|nr:unnamed protein product [Vitrella brassicaformis CCMP3155]|mmetsp:Transcript_8928/g.25725  ORF Transcript_8928/g.25725 Transcript_8928/m.25725 type:complete len:182 (+) Transcript_8928:332-877(+)|eukprot:CEM01995.1 unnamed protein product [Vitrella brassicaformis CCMP3155]
MYKEDARARIERARLEKKRNAKDFPWGYDFFADDYEFLHGRLQECYQILSRLEYAIYKFNQANQTAAPQETAHPTAAEVTSRPEAAQQVSTAVQVDLRPRAVLVDLGPRKTSLCRSQSCPAVTDAADDRSPPCGGHRDTDAALSPPEPRMIQAVVMGAAPVVADSLRLRQGPAAAGLSSVD